MNREACYNVAMHKHNSYNRFFELGQQKINFNFYGRFNPIMKFGVLIYAAMRGVREIDRIVELCKRQVRDVIEKNRKRKLTKHKKISNNSRIEIDHCSPLVLNRHRSSEKVYKEFMMYAIGRNINKYHRFLSSKLERFEGKKEENIA